MLKIKLHLFYIIAIPLLLLNSTINLGENVIGHELCKLGKFFSHEKAPSG